MRSRRVSEKDWSNWVIAVFVVLTFAGSKIYDSFSFKETVATKPYVDDRFTLANKYTDEKSAQTLKEAFEHSDTNRREMALEHAREHQEFMQQFTTVQSAAAIKIGTMETQLGNVLSTVREMRDTAWDAFEEQKIHRRKESR